MSTPGDGLIEDVSGHDLKPDPFRATSLEELGDMLRDFWLWAGRPSTRTVAKGSGGAFSRGTAGKLLGEEPGARPPLKLHYVQGCIRGCRGDDEDVRRWTTAWRSFVLPKNGSRDPMDDTGSLDE